jgi:hypothetical protein
LSRDDECLEEWEDEDLLDEDLLDEECLEELELLCEEEAEEDLLEDFSLGTSRMFRARPVVGSVVLETAGSWETWYPSMM